MCINTETTQGLYKDYFSYLPDSISLAHWGDTLPRTDRGLQPQARLSHSFRVWIMFLD
jgi:hypothetical protein